MAEIVFAGGTSHSPQTSAEARLWAERAQDDVHNDELYNARGDIVSFADLASAASGRFAPELDSAVQERRYAQCQEAIDRLAKQLIESKPDAVLVVGDDQLEMFDRSNLPALGVYWGERAPNHPLTSAGEFYDQAFAAYGWDGHDEFRIDVELGHQLIEGLVRHNIDVSSVTEAAPGRGLGHAYGFVSHRLLGKRSIPLIPVLLNTYYSPNQPTSTRCYDIGIAIGESLRAAESPKRVAVIASGGLSHFVIDEELDGTVLRALATADEHALRSLPERQQQSGSSEIRNWITVAGVMHGSATQWQEYVPCYRSAAGTGCGMAFAGWV